VLHEIIGIDPVVEGCGWMSLFAHPDGESFGRHAAMRVQNLALEDVIRRLVRGAVDGKFTGTVIRDALKFGPASMNGEKGLSVENLPFSFLVCQDIELGIGFFIPRVKGVEVVTIGHGCEVVGVDDPDGMLTSPVDILLNDNVIHLAWKERKIVDQSGIPASSLGGDAGRLQGCGGRETIFIFLKAEPVTGWVFSVFAEKRDSDKAHVLPASESKGDFFSGTIKGGRQAGIQYEMTAIIGVGEARGKKENYKSPFQEFHWASIT